MNMWFITTWKQYLYFITICKQYLSFIAMSQNCDLPGGTTGKTGAAVQATFAVHCRTATTPLSCEVRKMHGKAGAHDKAQAKHMAKKPTRQ